MADALLEKTTVTIGISIAKEKFQAKGELIKFDGFLKLYFESTDDDQNNGEEKILPPMKNGDILGMNQIQGQQKFTQQPPRYTEAMLVKKMEELGIGRPSTYAPTISTIQRREYAVKEDRPGINRNFQVLTLKDCNITSEEKSEKVGSEKAKLFPTDIGILVNQFLLDHFMNIMDYNFTATVEKEFDEIAEGKLIWNSMIKEFYGPFHAQIAQTLEGTKKVRGEKLLGTDPKTGLNVFVKIGRYGPMVQMGDADMENKPRFASLKKGQSMESLTLDDALDLFKLPRTLGVIDNVDVVVAAGRFGPYIKHQSQFFSLMKTDDPLTITIERASEIMAEKKKLDQEKTVREFDEEPTLKILKGKYGPYISYNKLNYKIPKGKAAEELTLEDCRKITTDSKPTKSSKSRKSK